MLKVKKVRKCKDKQSKQRKERESTVLSMAAYHKTVQNYEKAIDTLDYILINMIQAIGKRIQGHLCRHRGGSHGVQAECGPTFFYRVVEPYLKECGFEAKGKATGKDRQKRQYYQTDDIEVLTQALTVNGMKGLPNPLEQQTDAEQTVESYKDTDSEDIDSEEMPFNDDIVAVEVNSQHVAGVCYTPMTGLFHLNIWYVIKKKEVV